MRGLPFTTTGRDVPTWIDDGGFKYMAPEKIRVLVPLPMNTMNGAGLSTSGASTTTAGLGLVNVPAPIEVNRISYNVTVAGSANAVMRFAIYSEDGQQKIIDVTDAVGAATGVRTFTFTAAWLGPGNYYILFCLSSGDTGPTVNTYTTRDEWPTGAAGEPDVEGNHTVVGGAAPATFDPTAITTPFRNSTLYCRLDGAD